MDLEQELISRGGVLLEHLNDFPDNSRDSFHHSLGITPTQSSPGNHTHLGDNISKALSRIFLNSLFAAKVSAGQAVNGGAVIDINFDTIRSSSYASGIFTGTTFTAPTTGLYFFAASVSETYTNTSGGAFNNGASIIFSLNGESTVREPSGRIFGIQGESSTVTIIRLYQLATNDAVRVKAVGESTTTTINPNSTLTIVQFN